MSTISHSKEPSRMYHTTGFTSSEIADLSALISREYPRVRATTGRKKSLGLFRAVAVTLTYLRRHHVQDEIAEYYGISQPTVSRTIAEFVPILGTLLADWIPTADSLDPNSQLIIDGSLFPCWSWQNHPELYSGKHHRTGVNVQLACTLSGDLVWVSDPQPGNMHDSTAIRHT